MTIKEESFVKTAPIFDPKAPKAPPSEPVQNPQTANLCDVLGIDDPVQVLLARTGRTMKEPENYTTVASESISIESASPSVTKCSKLSLPAPITPSEDDREHLSQELPSSGFISPMDSFNTTDECSTPVSANKKTFKRRNVSIYNVADHEDSDSTASTVLDTDSSPCKIPFQSSVL